MPVPKLRTSLVIIVILACMLALCLQQYAVVKARQNLRNVRSTKLINTLQLYFNWLVIHSYFYFFSSQPEKRQNLHEAPPIQTNAETDNKDIGQPEVLLDLSRDAVVSPHSEESLVPSTSLDQAPFETLDSPEFEPVDDISVEVERYDDPPFSQPLPNPMMNTSTEISHHHNGRFLLLLTIGEQINQAIRGVKQVLKLAQVTNRSATLLLL